MVKKIFQAVFLPALITAFFAAMLSLQHSTWMVGLGIDLWILRGLFVSNEILVWLSGGWLFNRLLGLFFWDLLVGMYTEHHPPKMLVQISGIFVFFLTLSLIAHFVFDEPLTSI